MLRAFIGASFAALPAFVDRFGNSAFAMACVILGLFAGICAYLILRSEAQATWSIAVADAITLAVVLPLLAVASDVLVADEFLGGGVNRFSAAALAVGCAAAVVGGIAAYLGGSSIAPLAFLSAVLVVATGFVGAERFSADAFADGVSLAWMVAGIVTLCDGLLVPRMRPLVPLGTAVGYLLFIVVLARGVDTVDIPDGSIVVALLASAMVAGTLLVLPALGERYARSRD